MHVWNNFIFKPKSLKSLVLFLLRKELKQHLIKLTLYPTTEMLLSIDAEIRTVSKRANSEIVIKEREDDGITQNYE